VASSAMIDAARERAAKAERATRARCKQLPLRGEQPRQIKYIERQIDLGTREDKDLVLLRQRRREIMAEAERRAHG
jgi:hypothetical protein